MTFGSFKFDAKRFKSSPNIEINAQIIKYGPLPAIKFLCARKSNRNNREPLKNAIYFEKSGESTPVSKSILV